MKEEHRTVPDAPGPVGPGPRPADPGPARGAASSGPDPGAGRGAASDAGPGGDPYGFGRVVELVRRLRAPGGCPWDRAQTHRSLRRFALEEAYEVVAAIDAGDPRHLADELGDLLLQVLLHAQIAAEAGHFTIADVCHALADKLIRRHPHVFGGVEADSPADVQRLWAAIKRAEAAAREGVPAGEAAGAGGREGGASAAGVPEGQAGAGPAAGEAVAGPPSGAAGEPVPEVAGGRDDEPWTPAALVEAYRVQERAARLGLDWPDPRGPRAKLDEELAELDAAVAEGDPQHVEEELGDVLFVLVNAGRHWGVHAETALLGAVRKFRRRIHQMEEQARRQGRTLEELSPAELDRLWEAAKARETGRIQGLSAEHTSGTRPDARGGKRG
ncbi:MazG family protein [Thermaerobacter marianensis DSM 12885]|uniref:MazG family protein n=1 Tax=Thermaerobacter marianensis (strain ATCC 700841 / DSM 12885 / JCM 10246 / 7p75a) TaxID=644966 RepID=E6SL25_THEM7|nr:MazG family protein [Thermaerobacter marianensis DSM 12885]